MRCCLSQYGCVLLKSDSTSLRQLEQGKRRVQRVEELVIPEIESCRSMVAKRVIEGMKAAGVQGSKQELQAVHFKQTMKIVRSFLYLS